MCFNKQANVLENNFIQIKTVKIVKKKKNGQGYYNIMKKKSLIVGTYMQVCQPASPNALSCCLYVF